ncbi:UNVERIFIED_CONTAM: hypothetical protein FKN15_052752 [Acipenser sinensis]
METHLKRVYAAEAHATHLSNMASVLTAYMDGVLRKDPFPELVAMELRLLFSTLLQISGLQGQAIGRSLASLIVAHRQLWLSQPIVHTDKAMLIETPISPGHNFGPAVEEILQIPPGMRDVVAGDRIAPSLRFHVGQVELLVSSSDTDCHQDSSSPHGSAA